jgi:hypothetical protein
MRPLLFFPLLVVSTHAYILSQYDRYESLLQRSVRIRNKSGRRLEAYWVNNLDPNQPETFVAQSLDGEGILYGADCSISSYAGHEFEIRELPGKTSGTCLETNCWSGRFVVSMQQKQGKIPCPKMLLYTMHRSEQVNLPQSLVPNWSSLASLYYI